MGGLFSYPWLNILHVPLANPDEIFGGGEYYTTPWATRVYEVYKRNVMNVYVHDLLKQEQVEREFDMLKKLSDFNLTHQQKILIRCMYVYSPGK